MQYIELIYTIISTSATGDAAERNVLPLHDCKHNRHTVSVGILHHIETLTGCQHRCWRVSAAGDSGGSVAVEYKMSTAHQ